MAQRAPPSPIIRTPSAATVEIPAPSITVETTIRTDLIAIRDLRITDQQREQETQCGIVFSRTVQARLVEKCE